MSSSSPSPTSPNSAPKQRNRATKRTRDGCYTCKKRRIKCDEAKPSCNNCVKTHRACEGYRPRFEFRDGLNAKFRASTPTGSVSSVNPAVMSATSTSNVTPSTMAQQPKYHIANSGPSQGPSRLPYGYNAQIPIQSQPAYPYPVPHPQQFSNSGHPQQYQTPVPEHSNYQQVQYSASQQQQMIQSQHHHKNHRNDHSQSKTPSSSVSLPPINTLTFHESSSKEHAHRTSRHDSQHRSSHRGRENLQTEYLSSQDSKSCHSHDQKLALPPIQDCLMQQGKHSHNRELPPIHTTYNSCPLGISHSGTSSSPSPSSATSAKSVSSVSSAGSLAMSRSGTSDLRQSSITGILNSPTASNSYVSPLNPKMSSNVPYSAFQNQNYLASHNTYSQSSASPSSHLSPSPTHYFPSSYGVPGNNGAGSQYTQNISGQLSNASSNSQKIEYPQNPNMAPVFNNPGYNGYYQQNGQPSYSNKHHH